MFIEIYNQNMFCGFSLCLMFIYVLFCLLNDQEFCKFYEEYKLFPSWLENYQGSNGIFNLCTKVVKSLTLSYKSKWKCVDFLN